MVSSRELDIEMQDLPLMEDHTSAASSPRTSSDSAASRLLEEVNTVGRASPSYRDFETELEATIAPPKRLKRSVTAAIGVLLFIIYTAWLLSYRGFDLSARKDTTSKNATDVSTTSSVLQESSIAITSSLDPLSELLSSVMNDATVSHTPTPTSTKELVALTEVPTRPDREAIPQLQYESMPLTDTVMFLGSPSLTKDEDEGLYLINEGKRFFLKKLSDPNFDQTIYEGGHFKFQSKDLSIAAIVPNGDGSKALVLTNYEKQFRHSILAHYYILDVASGDMNIITAGKDTRIQHASWSPNFNYVSFVQDNDLYVFDVKSKGVDRVTKDGSGNIINGKTDWVYEEEVLSTDSAIWWSDDESKLAFLKFNETGVDELSLEKFDDGVYPTIQKIKYPKPGRTNPRLTLMMYDVQGTQISEVDRSDSKLGQDWVCYGARWIDGSLVVRESDRESKILDYRLFSEGVSRVVYTIDSAEYDGWIENFTEMVAIPRNETLKRANDGFVDIVEHDGYNHIGFFESLESRSPTMLTEGDWEVIKIQAFDRVENLLYFTANRQSHFEKHLFAVDIATKQLYAISDISVQGYHEPVFSNTARYIYDYNGGPTFPSLALLDTTKPISKAKKQTQDNQDNEKRSVDFTGARRSYHTVQLSDGATVDVIQMLPEKFHKDKKHPMIISVYGGPGFRNLNVMLHAGLEDAMSDDLTAVILYIEPRGTGGQGWKYRSYAKRHIGHWEPRDLTELTKLWINSRNYIDEEKVAVWGWSYGGFTTLKTLEYDKGETFKYGMAVAPVTDWRMYDSIYTERYMDQPKDNGEGYKESRVANVRGLKGVKRFVLMHGTGDDNVHVQNTFKLVDDMNLHAVTNFDLMIYPDSNHNIDFHNAYSVLTIRLRDWLKEHLL